MLPPQRRSARQPRGAGFAALALALTSACATLPRRTPAPEVSDFDRATGELAEALVSAAELRTSLGSMRILVDDLVAVASHDQRYARVAGQEREMRSLQATLEHELTMALSNRVHVFEHWAEAAGHDHDEEPTLEECAAELGATHAVVGSFVVIGGDIDVSLRLVEIDTQLIVAAARGRLPYIQSAGYDRTAAAGPSAPVAAERMPVVPVPVATVTTTSPDASSPGATSPPVNRVPVTGPSSSRNRAQTYDEWLEESGTAVDTSRATRRRTAELEPATGDGPANERHPAEPAVALTEGPPVDAAADGRLDTAVATLPTPEEVLESPRPIGPAALRLRARHGAREE